MKNIITSINAKSCLKNLSFAKNYLKTSSIMSNSLIQTQKFNFNDTIDSK